MVSRDSSEIAQSQATIHKAVYSKSLSTSSKPEQALYSFRRLRGYLPYTSPFYKHIIYMEVHF